MVGLRMPPGLKLSAVSLPCKLPDSLSLPWPSLGYGNAQSQSGSPKNVKWIEGIRGLAALLVVTCHLCSAMDPDLLQPQDNSETAPRFFQRQFIRIIAAGRPSVAVFFILTGFTNALRPIKVSYSGETDGALLGLSRSTTKRAGQLVIPCAIATFINWLFCQLGFFNFAQRVGSSWILMTAPKPSPTMPDAVGMLFRNIASTWTHESNYYDPVQWCMARLLGASMWTYITMIATVRCRPAIRIWILITLITYSVLGRDSLVGINTFSGILLAEFSILPGTIFTTPTPSMLRTIIASCLITTGLYLASFPEYHPELTAWSKELNDLVPMIFPEGTDSSRLWTSLGSISLLFGVLMSPTAKSLLSHPWLYEVGKLSLPIFLTHNLVLRTIFVWIVFGMFGKYPVPKPPEPGQAGPPEVDPNAKILKPAWPYTFVVGVLTMCVVLYVAHLWSLFIEPWCTWGSNQIEELIFAKEDGTSALPPPIIILTPRPGSPQSAHTLVDDSPDLEKFDNEKVISLV